MDIIVILLLAVAAFPLALGVFLFYTGERSLAAQAAALSALIILLAGVTHASDKEDESLKQKATSYGIEIIKTSDDGFVGTDLATGKTLKCSFTEDEKSLVCNGTLRQRSK